MEGKKLYIRIDESDEDIGRFISILFVERREVSLEELKSRLCNRFGFNPGEVLDEESMQTIFNREESYPAKSRAVYYPILEGIVRRDLIKKHYN